MTQGPVLSNVAAPIQSCQWLCAASCSVCVSFLSFLVVGLDGKSQSDKATSTQPQKQQSETKPLQTSSSTLVSCKWPHLVSGCWLARMTRHPSGKDDIIQLTFPSRGDPAQLVYMCVTNPCIRFLILLFSGKKYSLCQSFLCTNRHTPTLVCNFYCIWESHFKSKGMTLWDEISLFNILLFKAPVHIFTFSLGPLPMFPPTESSYISHANKSSGWTQCASFIMFSAITSK